MSASVRLAGVTAGHLDTWIREHAPVRVLDLRTLEAYETGHIETADHVPPAKPVSILDRISLDGLTVLVCEDGTQSRTVAAVLVECGLTTITWLEGGMKAWTSSARRKLRPRALTAKELKERLGTIRVIDVRDPHEFRQGRVPGSVNIPFDDGSADDLVAAAQGFRQVVLVSGSGRRADLARRRLASAGIEADVLAGGIAGWAMSPGARMERGGRAVKILLTAAAVVVGAVAIVMGLL